MPTDIDRRVAGRLKDLRLLRGLSQIELAALIGVTFQQVQKYERGINRIGASRLYAIAETLDVSIGFFFDGLPVVLKVAAPELATRETGDLIAAYYRLPEDKRRAVFNFVKRIAANKEG
jgi:transcriptional regulator with XRE-family HTH domain